MDANDPRHGTQAGFSQHVRDDEKPCADCRNGDAIAGRRRRKRVTQGHRHTLPVGQTLYTQLTELRDEGASIHKIAEWAGVGYRSAYAVLRDGPEARIYTRTHQKLSALRPPTRITTTGLTRRLQALQRLGYSIPVIAAESGLSKTQLRNICDGVLTAPTKHATRDAIAATYDRLQLSLPATDTASQRKSVTQARNRAERHGWPSPLAFDDIDHDTTPRGVRDPRCVYDGRDLIDESTVLRVLAGEVLPTSHAERHEIMRRWKAAGNSERSLCERMSWKDGRYDTKGSAA